MSRVALLAVVALVFCACPAWTMDNPGPGWEQVSESPEIWKDPTVSPAVFYNAQKFVVEAQEDGTYKVADEQPMTFTGTGGENTGMAMEITPENKTKFKIQEDNDQCQIEEHSVAYNDTAVADAQVAQTPPQRDIQWVVKDEDGNEVQRQEGSNTSYAPTFTKPGVYNLSNGGVSEVPPSETMEAGGSVKTGQNAELEVVDVTAPTGSFAFIPEDHHEVNEVRVEKTVNTDKYPMVKKEAELQVAGKNFNPDALSNWEAAAAVSTSKPIPYGNPYVPEEFKGEVTVSDVGNGELETKLRSENEVDVAETIAPLNVPVHVRTKFRVDPPTDNGSKDSEVKYTWSLKVTRDGNEEVHEEPPHFEFPVANYNSDGRIDDTPEYVFSYKMEDVAGNKTTVNVPIRVLDVGVDIKDIESRSGRK